MSNWVLLCRINRYLLARDFSHGEAAIRRRTLALRGPSFLHFIPFVDEWMSWALFSRGKGRETHPQPPTPFHPPLLLSSLRECCGSNSSQFILCFKPSFVPAARMNTHAPHTNKAGCLGLTSTTPPSTGQPLPHLSSSSSTLPVIAIPVFPLHEFVY
jgi:hypothetical protein